MTIKEGKRIKSGSTSTESLPYRPAPPAPNKTVKQMTKDPAAEWQAGYDAGVEAAAKALEDDARKCDCFALEERECGCGAWCEWKSITSARAVEIVRKLSDTQ